MALAQQLGLCPAKGALYRGVVAGSAWGLSVAAALIGMHFWNCGVLCLGDAAFTTALSVTAGLATMRPLAAFGRAS
jgi:hypothetical protein